MNEYVDKNVLDDCSCINRENNSIFTCLSIFGRIIVDSNRSLTCRFIHRGVPVIYADRCTLSLKYLAGMTDSYVRCSEASDVHRAGNPPDQ